MSLKMPVLFNTNSRFRIRRNIELYSVEDHYLRIFNINSRKTREFKVSPVFFYFLDHCNGKNTFEAIKKKIIDKFFLNDLDCEQVAQVLLSNGIIEDYKKIRQPSRFLRQISFFEDFHTSEMSAVIANKKLINQSFVILGVGAVGGGIAIQLTMLGIKQITILDYKNVAESDAARHSYFNREHIGRPKVDSLKDFLISINPKIKVNTFVSFITPNSDLNSYINKSDFVVNCLDEPYIGYTSSIVGKYCMTKNINHYIAGGFDAHSASTGELIIPFVTPCVFCYRNYFEKILKDWKPITHEYVPEYVENGGTISHSLFSAAYACYVIVEFIANLNPKTIDQSRGEFLSDKMDIYFLDVKKDPNCKVCGKIHAEQKI